MDLHWFVMRCERGKKVEMTERERFKEKKKYEDYKKRREIENGLQCPKY